MFSSMATGRRPRTIPASPTAEIPKPTEMAGTWGHLLAAHPAMPHRTRIVVGHLEVWTAVRRDLDWDAVGPEPRR
jgi:hypothetical protein